MSNVRRMRKLLEVAPETEAAAIDLEATLKAMAQGEFDALAASQGLTAGEAAFVKRIVPPFDLPPSEDGRRRDMIAYIFEADAT